MAIKLSLSQKPSFNKRVSDSLKCGWPNKKSLYTLVVTSCILNQEPKWRTATVFGPNISNTIKLWESCKGFSCIMSFN